MDREAGPCSEEALAAAAGHPACLLPAAEHLAIVRQPGASLFGSSSSSLSGTLSLSSGESKFMEFLAGGGAVRNAALLSLAD